MATLTICIVFVSVVFLTGPAKYLFTPMALAVVFAMLASYVLSRTLVPVMAAYLLRGEQHEVNPETGLSEAPQAQAGSRRLNGFNDGYIAVRTRYTAVLQAFYGASQSGVRVSGVAVGDGVRPAAVRRPRFLPQVDAGQFRLHVRAAPGLGWKAPRWSSAGWRRRSAR